MCKVSSKMALFSIRLKFETKAKHFSTTSMIKELKKFRNDECVVLHVFKFIQKPFPTFMQIALHNNICFFFSATVKCVNQFNSLESSSMKNWNYTYVERYECLSNGTTQTSPNQFRLIQLDVNMRDIVQSNGSINQLITWSVIRNHV